MPLTRGATDLAMWRRLLGDDAWRRWAVAAFLARLPITSTIIAFATAAKALTGRAGHGVVLGSAAAFLAALTAPSAGRLADQYGPRPVLAAAAALTALAAAGGGLVVLIDAPLALLALAAGAYGLALAPVQGCLRATLLGALPAAWIGPATTAEAVLIEATFIAGPGIAALIGTTVGAAPILFAISGCATAVAVLAHRIPRNDAAEGAGMVTVPSSVLVRLRGVLAVTFVGGLGLGSIQGSVPALAERGGASAAAGGYLHALVATGALLGGLAFARSRPRGAGAPPGLLGWGATGLALLALPLPMPMLVACLLVAGAPIAPLNALGMAAAAARAGSGRQAEAGASYFAALALGVGTGGLLTGVALGPSTPGPILVTAALTIAGLAVCVRLRQRPPTFVPGAAR